MDLAQVFNHSKAKQHGRRERSWGADVLCVSVSNSLQLQPGIFCWMEGSTKTREGRATLTSQESPKSGSSIFNSSQSEAISAIYGTEETEFSSGLSKAASKRCNFAPENFRTEWKKSDGEP